MTTATRKKSPRAPSLSLGDAVEKACKIYEMERCHAAPVDGVAKHIGYKDAKNGAALSTLASLKYYGLLDRPKDGMLAASKDVEAFRFSPTETIRRSLITKWLKSPQVFSELLDKYTEGLPSDATLKYDLIQRGFAPATAEICLQAFRRSVDYANYFEQSPPTQAESPLVDDIDGGGFEEEQGRAAESEPQGVGTLAPSPPIATVIPNADVDRIPVRLTGGRRAWIEIPMPFYGADKERLKKQIDLLLTNDEESVDDLA
jgi:hypothetical protein